MPRKQSPSRQSLLDSAMASFWKHGYRAVSVGDLVRETGVSRSSLYSAYADKEALFEAVLDHYQAVVVTPVFGQVEEDGAGVDAIAAYMENLVMRSLKTQNTSVGCLIGNTFGQVGPENATLRAKLLQHTNRLTRGFAKVLTHENAKQGLLSADQIADLARHTMISVQGLWLYARQDADPTVLRRQAAMITAHLRQCLAGGLS